MKQLLRASTFGLLLLSAVVGAPATMAAADPPALGACPTGWKLYPVAFVLQHVDDPNGFPSWDPNGDGYTCVLFIDPAAAELVNFHRVAIVDNAQPLP